MAVPSNKNAVSVLPIPSVKVAKISPTPPRAFTRTSASPIPISAKPLKPVPASSTATARSSNIPLIASVSKKSVHTPIVASLSLFILPSTLSMYISCSFMALPEERKAVS